MLRVDVFPKFFLTFILVISATAPVVNVSAGRKAAISAVLDGPNFWVFLEDFNSDPYDGVQADIQGYGWPNDKAISLTIDLHDTVPSPDYTFEPSDFEDQGGGLIHVYFPFVTVHPGDVVSMTNGDISLTHTVTPLAVTQMNIQAASISGTAAPGSLVYVELREPYFIHRNETTKPDGTWMADFSVPGDEAGEEATASFTPGLWMWVRQDNGQTQAYQPHVYAPWFYVWFENWGNPNNGIHFDVHGYEWPSNTPVTMTVDKLETPLSPDYTRIAYMETPEWGGDPQLVFDTAGMVVHTGDLVSLTDGTYTIHHTITALTVSGFDVDLDTVSGTAEPGSVVELSLLDLNVYRHVTTKPDGTWIAYFSVRGVEPDEQDVADLVPGSKFFIGQSNPGNPKAVNAYGIQIPNPYIEARPGPDWIRAWNWQAGVDLTLMIDDPNTPQPVDYSANDTAVNEPPCENPDCTIGFFDLVDFDLKPGQIVSIWAGARVKSYTVAFFGVTNYDFEADTITGTGLAGHFLQVCADTSATTVCRAIQVGTDESWSADFHIPGPNPGEDETLDLQGGSNGWINDSRTRWRLHHSKLVCQL